MKKVRKTSQQLIRKLLHATISNFFESCGASLVLLFKRSLRKAFVPFNEMSEPRFMNTVDVTYPDKLSTLGFQSRANSSLPGDSYRVPAVENLCFEYRIGEQKY